MTDDLGTEELSSPATNGASDSASAISVRSNGDAKANDGEDEKALSAVNFVVAEINRIAEEISLRSNGNAKANDGSDEKSPSTVTFLIAEINRLAEKISSNANVKANDGSDEKAPSTVTFLVAELNKLAEENQQLKRKYNDVEKRLALLKEAIKPFRTNDFLSSVCLIAGSAGVGAVLSYLSLNSYGWCVFVGMSALLVIAGIIAKVGGPSLGTTTRQAGLL